MQTVRAHGIPLILMWLVKYSFDQCLQNPCCEYLFIKMNKIFLIIVICFLANTQGSTRTRRALPPGYLSVDGTEYCLETERMPGTSSSYLCIPARMPSRSLEQPKFCVIGTMALPNYKLGPLW